MLQYVAALMEGKDEDKVMYLSAKGHLCTTRRLAFKAPNREAVMQGVQRWHLDPAKFSAVPLIATDADAAHAFAELSETMTPMEALAIVVAGALSAAGFHQLADLTVEML